MVAYLSDYGFSGLGPDNWRWMFGIEAVPGAALAIAMVFVPHTPRWPIQNGQPGRAGEVLHRTRSGADVDGEISDIKNAVQVQRKTLLWQALTSRRLLPFLVIGVALAGLQQADGINAVIYFGAQDLKVHGLHHQRRGIRGVTIGIVNFAFTLVAVPLLHWIGRKVLLIVSTAEIVAALAAEGWYWSQGTSFAHSNGMIGLGTTLAYLAFFEFGIGPVMWVMISEIYPVPVRSKAMAMATMVNWTFNFLVRTST